MTDKNVEQVDVADAAPVSQATPAPARAFRKTVPVAPRLQHDASAATVERIRNALTAGLYQDHPEAPAKAAYDVGNIPVINCHPQVASYKAEVLDYLDGKSSGV